MNSQQLDLVQKWVEINRKLDEGWNPLRSLAGERDEIEKQIPFLKNKGVSPYPPKEEKEKSSLSTILIDPSSKSPAPPVKKAKTGKSEEGAKRAVERLKGQGGSGKRSKSETGMDEDHSQSFQGENK